MIPFVVMVSSDWVLWEWAWFHGSIDIINLIMMMLIMNLSPYSFMSFSFFFMMYSFTMWMFSQLINFNSSESRSIFIWIRLFLSVVILSVSWFIN
jgi:hypothetical protein